MSKISIHFRFQTSKLKEYNFFNPIMSIFSNVSKAFHVNIEVVYTV